MMPKTHEPQDSTTYHPLPSYPNQGIAVLVPYHRPRRRDIFLRRCLFISAPVLLVCLAVFLLFPSDPTLQLSRLRLNHVRVHSSPELTLDLSFSAIIRVRNRDFFSLDYDSLVVEVQYRGRELGFVRSGGGHVRARGSSYVNATVDVDGFEVVHDVVYLIEDVAEGAIPFDTVTYVDGRLGLFSFEIPIKGRVSCEVLVSTNNQTIIRQDCYT